MNESHIGTTIVGLLANGGVFNLSALLLRLHEQCPELHTLTVDQLSLIVQSEHIQRLLTARRILTLGDFAPSGRQ